MSSSSDSQKVANDTQATSPRQCLRPGCVEDFPTEEEVSSHYSSIHMDSSAKPELASNVQAPSARHCHWPSCGKDFSTDKEASFHYNAHLDKSDLPKPATCYKCGHETRDYEAFEAHMHAHPQSDPPRPS